MPRGSSPERERRYEHIKDRERARHGASETAGRSSVKDVSSSRRGGPRSYSGSRGPTKKQPYNEAEQRNPRPHEPPD